MRKQDKEGFRIAVDTREKHPFKYENGILKTLKTGDYSILGFESKITIERKSKTDAYSSLGAGRIRFENELKRLSEFDYSAIVIESSLADFLQAPPFTRMNPKAALNSLVSWSVKYKVFIFFASDRQHARALVYRILEKYFKYRSDNDNKQQ